MDRSDLMPEPHYSATQGSVDLHVASWRQNPVLVLPLPFVKHPVLDTVGLCSTAVLVCTRYGLKELHFSIHMRILAALRALDGSTLSLHPRQECTSSVCVANEHGTGISARQQCLPSAGKLLRGDAPLGSLGIQSGSKIQLKLGLLGGVWDNTF